jgi:tetratricopeptide (TPR) repeat protein
VNRKQRRAAKRQKPQTKAVGPPARRFLAEGLQHHRAGQLDQARALYLLELAVDPKNADALNFLGVLCSQQDDPSQAVELIRKALIEKPNSPDVHNNLGLALAALGKTDEAIAAYRRAIAIQPNLAEAHNNIGLALAAFGSINEAIAAFRRAVAIKPEYPEAHYNLGVSFAALDNIDDAIAAYQHAIFVRPDYAEAHNNLGLAFSARGETDVAIAAYRRAIFVKPDYAEAHNNLGLAFTTCGKTDDAIAAYRRAIAIRPGYAEAHSNSGIGLAALGKTDDAMAAFRRAIAIRPDYAEAHSNHGLTLVALGKPDEAIAAFRHAVGIRPDYAEGHNNLGVALTELKRFEEASESFNRALALRPNYAEAHNNIGNVLRALGQLQEAREAYLEALRLGPSSADVYINLADAKTFTAGDPHLAAMEARVAMTDRLSKTDRMKLDFALGKAYADLKDYHRSFEHLLAGNTTKRAMISYDEKSAFALFDRVEAVFTPELIKAKSGAGDPSAMPIFVLGMPRSGTTLVEQIVASHPMVHGAGELRSPNEAVWTFGGADGNMIPYPEFVPTVDASDLRQIGARYVAKVRELVPCFSGSACNEARGEASKRVTDKTLANYYLAGLIHLALPNAKILHTIRDPIDTCLSCFSKLFAAEQQQYTYDLGELGRYFKRYERLMAHWRRVLPAGRILDITYENVVADLEGQARSIISHCGLPWDDRCLSFHETDRPVSTASAMQVRQPIYTNAVGRWRVYSEHLGPLLSALDVITSMGE